METILIDLKRSLELDTDRLPFTGDSGFYGEPLFVVSRATIRDMQDAEDLIAAITAIPAYFTDNILNMQRGIGNGICRAQRSAGDLH